MRIKQVASLFVLFFCFCLTSFSQRTDTLEARYRRDNIVRLGGGFIKNGERITFEDLRGEFSRSPVGYDLYQAARRSKTNARIFNVGSFLSLIAVFSFAAANNRTGSLVSMGSQVFFTLLSGAQRKNTTLMTDRALIERNRDVLFR